MYVSYSAGDELMTALLWLFIFIFLECDTVNWLYVRSVSASFVGVE